MRLDNREDHLPAEESTHERILRIAAEMFAKNGYHATGVAQLGDAVGIQRGALYYHIGSKEELLYRLSRRHVEAALLRGREAMMEADNAIDRLRLLVRTHLRTLTSRRAEVAVVMREMPALTGEWAEQLVALRSEYEGLFATVIQQGVAEGVFRTAGRIEQLGLLSMINYTHVWLDPDGSEPVDEVADRLTDLVLHGQLSAAAKMPPTVGRAGPRFCRPRRPKFGSPGIGVGRPGR